MHEEKQKQRWIYINGNDQKREKTYKGPLRISRPGVRVPSIAPENAVKSKDFMAFLFFATEAAHFTKKPCYRWSDPQKLDKNKN